MAARAFGILTGSEVTAIFFYSTARMMIEFLNQTLFDPGSSFWQTTIFANTLRVMAVLILSIVASTILQRLVRLACDHIRKTRTDLDSGKRIETIRRVAKVAVRIVVWSFAGIIILSTFGVSIAPLLTAAGVTGIAVGFAAQSLVKDYFSGFIVLLEGQLRVGDIVEIGGRSGLVEDITLRCIRLRDYDGQVVFVPCGSIGNVVNKSMDFAQAVIDVGVAYREDISQALRVMREVAHGLVTEHGWADRILAPAEIVGVERLADSAVILRLRIKVQPGEQWNVRREYLQRIKLAMQNAGLEIPFPHLTVMSGETKPLANFQTGN